MRQPVRKNVANANGVDQVKYSYTLVVDGNNIMKMASVDHRMNGNGEEYGVVMSSLRMIGDILKKKDFNYCYVVYDGEGSGFLRWELYPDYKANRGKQYDLYTDYMKKYKDYSKMVIEYHKGRKSDNPRQYGEDEDESFERQKYILQSILEELCIRQYMFDNVEGDDIISYIVQNRKENEKIVIASSDKDLTQLISENVIVYNPRTKGFVTKDNSVAMLGITHENVVLEKILCGDQSDNIKGIKGIGESTLLKLFPEIKTEKSDLDGVIRRSKEMLEERRQQKKKPLKALENIVNSVTDGCQGKEIYEINRKIIDLSRPLVTEEAESELRETLYVPIDTSDRSVKNVYGIISENEMYDLTDETRFGDILGAYSRIMMMEQKRYKESVS